MMWLRQQEQAKHAVECVALGTEVQNPAPVTQQQRLSELEGCLLHYIKSRNSRENNRTYNHSIVPQTTERKLFHIFHRKKKEISAQRGKLKKDDGKFSLHI